MCQQRKRPENNFLNQASCQQTELVMCVWYFICGECWHSVGEFSVRRRPHVTVEAEAGTHLATV